MTEHADTGDHGRRRPPGAGGPSSHATGRRTHWLFGAFAAAALLLLALEHRPHLFGWLPWLILLACPLMHLFMHHGHHRGAHGHTGATGSERRPPKRISPEREMDDD